MAGNSLKKYAGTSLEVQKSKASRPQTELNETDPDSDAGRLRSLMKQVETLIAQLDGLYRQYALGVEERAPAERRHHLDTLATTMLYAPKPTPVLKFRFEGLYNRYITMRDRWDKLIRDLEAGKIKRVTGSKKNRAYRM